jgi:hypothetical protein
MKKFQSILIFVLMTVCAAQAQESSPDKQWNFGADVNFYFIPHDFFILPVVRADKNALHLEARYNYEDMETFSGWIGYNFMGGNEFEYTITPIVGGVVGLTDGIAPGLEFTLSYKGFELYNEAEYLFDAASNENNFYYNWADLTYSPTDWLWVGISGQRTRLYQTDLDIQRGFLLGGGSDHWEVSGYLYNIFFDDPFVMISFSANF